MIDYKAAFENLMNALDNNFGFYESAEFCADPDADLDSMVQEMRDKEIAEAAEGIKEKIFDVINDTIHEGGWD